MPLVAQHAQRVLTDLGNFSADLELLKGATRKDGLECVHGCRKERDIGRGKL
jgi:hypothetical protein